MSDVPGERTSPYQITFPNNDKVCRNNFKEEYLSNLPYVNRKELKERVKDLHFGFPSPPMLKKEMLHLEGCARWSGGSVDTHKNILYLNIDQEPVIVSISKSMYWKGQYAYDVKPFRDKLQFPAIKPPWGAIVAFDLKNGKTLWKVPFGEWEKLKKINIPKTGTKNRAGITASSGGVIFASGTWDDKFIVVNSSNGKTLWEFKMSAPGSAPPTTYLINEKQYVLVPAFEKRGRSIYAFSLN